MNNHSTDRNQNYSFSGSKQQQNGVSSTSKLHLNDMSPNRLKQNGAIASLASPTSLSIPQRGPSPSLASASPPLSPGSRGIPVGRNRLNSPPQHYHLPTYRFVDEDSRPKSALGSAIDCQRCGRKRRDPTWLEIQAAYDLLDTRHEDVDRSRFQMESVADRRRHFEAAKRLQEANNELDRLLDELEAFSCSSSTAASRSKSTPDFNYFNDPAAYSPTLTDYQLLPPRNRYFYNLRKEEMLRRQRADKLALEIEDRKSRRHGYIPNLSPSLQNDFGRLEQLLNDFRPLDPDARSTPNMMREGSLRSRSLSSSSLRVPLLGMQPIRQRSPPPLTCTAIYKFVAHSPRELSLEVGDLAYVRRRINEDWIEGERNGFIGIFPATYVRFNV